MVRGQDLRYKLISISCSLSQRRTWGYCDWLRLWLLVMASRQQGCQPGSGHGNQHSACLLPEHCRCASLHARMSCATSSPVCVPAGSGQAGCSCCWPQTWLAGAWTFPLWTWWSTLTSRSSHGTTCTVQGVPHALDAGAGPSPSSLRCLDALACAQQAARHGGKHPLTS